MQKGFAPILFILVGVLVIGVLMGGAYLLGILGRSITFQTLQPSLDETANWKTYTNTKYGFSIRYPNSLSAIEQTADIYLRLVSFKEQDKKTDDGFDIEIRDSKSLDEEIAYRKWQVVGHVTDGISEEKKINRNGYDGVILFYETADDSGNRQKSAIIIITTEKYAYSIYAKALSVDSILLNFNILK